MQLPDPSSQRFKNLAGLVALIAAGGLAFWAFGPKTKQGQAAYAAMSGPQQAIAAKLLALPPGAPVSAVSAILGTPFENQDVFARWRGPVTPEKTRILAQFPGKKLNKLTYLATDLTWSWTIQSNGQRMVVVEAK